MIDPQSRIGHPHVVARASAACKFVLRVGADDTAQRVPVRTDGAQGELVEVAGDIAADDRLVVRGGERLMPGPRVKIESAMEDAPALAAGGR